MTMNELVWTWHVHHNILVEKLTEPIKNRIAYIKAAKDPSEIELRLRLLQPVKNQRKISSAFAEYEKVEQSALAEYTKVEQSAWAEYKKVVQPAWAEYNKVEQSALAEYNKVEQSAWAEYRKVVQPALAEYTKVEQSALAEYKKVVEELHDEECPNCPWNGQTILLEVAV